MLLLISGAFGLFRRDAVIEAAAFMHGTVARTSNSPSASTARP
jgi:hypothetical protein